MATYTTEQKEEFILLKAQGYSNRVISNKTKIPVRTLNSWAISLSREIAHRRDEEISAIYDQYKMTRIAKMRTLGETLNKIDTALDSAILETTSVDKLLDLKLKYIEALKKEYIPLEDEQPTKQITAQELIGRAEALYQKAHSGDISQEQYDKEKEIISLELKAIEETDLERRLDELEQALSRAEATEAEL